MYINPFVAGVLATVGVELAAMLISSIVIMIRRKRR